ncbi:MAG TPA: transglycosylase domain-containing protein, partial [Phenylobacterium sp.]|nr:transglycosylase domain-containing protein [Phenylobacterium sp.]
MAAKLEGRMGVANQPESSHASGRVRRLLLAAGAVAAICAIAAVGVAWTAWRLPLDRPLNPASRPAMVFLAADGTPFARRGADREAPVDAAALPPLVTAAFVAVEDRHFYSHFGMDPAGTGRAALVNLVRGHVAQGGSTITQQLAKTYVGDERSYGRKLREMLVALALEIRLTKNEILSRYLSTAYFGSGAYGLRAAARTYFDKAPEDLSLSEAAILAGLLKAPSALAPNRDLAPAQARARLVLSAMADSGMISAAQAANAPPAELAPSRQLVPVGEFFQDWIAAQTKAPERSGYGEITVPTTLDLKLQIEAEQAVAHVLQAGGRSSNAHQAALVAMRPDGTVVAMVGGEDYGRSQFNRAVQSRRQPGSSFKLFVYLAALRQGATPDTLVADEPVAVGNWRPENASGRYQGLMTLRDAFAHSSNVAAVRVSESVGRGEVVRAARDLGISGPLKAVPSLALGANEVTLLDMTSAYAAVAAGGYPVTPTGLQGVAGSQPVAARRSLPEQGHLLALLNAAAEQGAGLGGALPYPVFGKTGTTQNNRDAWFIGFAG